MMFRRLSLSLGLLAGLLVASPLAQAGVMATADLDWRSLTVTLVDLNPLDPVSFSWDTTSENGSVWVSAQTADPYDIAADNDEAFDWSTLLSKSALTTLAQGNALRSADTMSANAASQAGVSVGAPDFNYANGQTYNSADFSMSGHGIALITVNWALSVTGLVGDYSNLAYASATINADFSDGVTDGSSWNSAWLQSSDNGDNATVGTLWISIVNLPDTVTDGSFYADIYTFAQTENLVPEPSTFALTGLGLGLVGLVAYRRRRK
jgi:hypothetical protein